MKVANKAQKRDDNANNWNVDISNLRDRNTKIKEAIKRIEMKVGRDINSHKWLKNTVLIASDSMFNQLDEKRLTRNGKNVKVRAFSGSTITDMYFYLYPLLLKNPDYIILHIGTNDCVTNTAIKVFDDLLLLKAHIEKSVPGIKVILSQPIMRYDVPLTCSRVSELIEKLNVINAPQMENNNILRKHIGRKGLHLNEYGTARCAMNIISLIKGL